MKISIVILSLLVLGLSKNYSQNTNQLGLSFGSASLIGDIGSTHYTVYAEKPSIGIVYKHYRNEMFSYRVGFSALDIKAEDIASNHHARRIRGLSVSNVVWEAFFGGEFNFLSFKPHIDKFQISPYISLGPALIVFQTKHFENHTVKNEGLQYNMALPVILGTKIKVKRFVLAAEIGARYTFTDNIDGSSPPARENRHFGFGQNNRDWYFFTNLSVLFILNRVKCFTCFE